MFGDWPSPNVHNMSAQATAAACEALCEAAAPDGGCYSWTWYTPTGRQGAQWDGKCFLRTDAVWSPTTQGSTYSGYCAVPPPVPNVWVANLTSGGTPLPASLYAPESTVLTLLVSADGGVSTQRAFRARWPNADLERDLFPKGWASGAVRTAAPCNQELYNVTHVPLPDNYGPGMFTDYYFGEGSTCDRFEDGEWLHGPPTVSYW